MSKLTDLALEVGRAGISWNAFCFRDDVGQLCDTADNDIEAAQASWEQGDREHRQAHGWLVCWTTAPDCYDTFGTETIETCGEWKGRELRRVLMNPDHSDYQRDRYGSGLHGSWEQDPRVEEARLAEQAARWKAEDEAKATKRAEDLRHVQSLSDEAFDKFFAEFHDADNRDDPLPISLSQADMRKEGDRRREVKRAESLRVQWEKCVALVPEGCTILDNGTEGFRGIYGWIKGVDPRVLYRVKIVPHWHKDKAGDPDEATVESDGHLDGPSLKYTADRIEKGRYQIVSESDVPPRPVAERFGMENVKKIKKVEIGTRTVWISQKNAWSDIEVLDEKGRIVRAKKIRAEALRIVSEST
jgi:hypothetical protein